MYCVYCCCKPQFLHGIGAFILKMYENQRYVMELMVHLSLVGLKILYSVLLEQATLICMHIRSIMMVLWRIISLQMRKLQRHLQSFPRLICSKFTNNKKFSKTSCVYIKNHVLLMCFGYLYDKIMIIKRHIPKLMNFYKGVEVMGF